MSFQPLLSSSLTLLCRRASQVRDQGKGRTVSFSPKVFIPLTQLCRDFCGYCTFRRSPRQNESLYWTPEEVLKVARRGEELGCREALFVLGERPEERYPQARIWLKQRGYDSTVEYLYAMCRLVLEETSLFPHSNPGNLTFSELESLRSVNASLGLMLENSSSRLCCRPGPHFLAPSKNPQARLQTLASAGRLRIPFTTGLLVGIGETVQERMQSLLEIRKLQEKYGHLQEVIIQNFQPKPGTRMAKCRPPSLETMLRTVTWARILLGPRANIQVPPNLFGGFCEDPHRRFLEAGINDWGGVSPLTIDYVNPEAPWPHLRQLKELSEGAGFRLEARFPVYPDYFLEDTGFVDADLRKRLLAAANSQGYIRDPISLLSPQGEQEEQLA